METSCPQCGTAYGKRRRCYVCSPGKRKTGETRACKQCGAEFYAERNQIEDTARNSATYCSVKCKGDALKGRDVPWARRGELIEHSAGYLLAWAPDHPRASRGRVFEHILVMEEKLGRRLEPGEFVHHIDEDKKNNRPENLEAVTNPDHWKKHAPTNPGLRRRRVTITCQECGVAFEVQAHRVNAAGPRNERKYCSRACYVKSWHRQMDAKRRSKET